MFKDQLKKLRLDPEAFNFVFEPTSRNTAPAIALGVRFAEENLGIAEDEVIFVAPSDHLIEPEDAFGEYLEKAETLAGRVT